MFIRTERLMLRPIFPEDWRDVFGGLCDQGIVRMLSRAPWPYTPDHAREYCNRQTAPHDLQFGITVPGDDGAPLIGQVGIVPHEQGGLDEIGYWIGRGWQGRGYATEAVRGALAVARAVGLTRIAGGHFVDNPASGKVLRNCGFEETGEIVPTSCAGRDGAAVPAMRYACILGG